MDANFISKLKDFNTFIQVFTTIGSVIVASLIAFIAYSMAPLAEDIKDLRTDVYAIMDDRKSVPEWRTRTAILEQKALQEEKDIDEIKQDLKDIKSYFLIK